MTEDVAGEQQVEIPKGRITFEFDPATGNIKWGKEGAPIPHAILVNALELCKMMYVQEQLMMVQMKRKPALAMPDGTPFHG